jgi:hypothetical protein
MMRRPPLDFIHFLAIIRSGKQKTKRDVCHRIPHVRRYALASREARAKMRYRDARESYAITD